MPRPSPHSYPDRQPTETLQTATQILVRLASSSETSTHSEFPGHSLLNLGSHGFVQYPPGGPLLSGKQRAFSKSQSELRWQGPPTPEFIIVASGIIASGIIASGTVTSETVASGIIASGIIASETVASETELPASVESTASSRQAPKKTARSAIILIKMCSAMRSRSRSYAFYRISGS